LINLVSMPVGLAVFFVPYMAVILHWKLPAIFAAMLVVRLLALLVLIRFTVKVSLMIWSGWPDKSIFRSLATFGAWVTGPNLVQPVVSPLDRLFLARFISLSALTYYSAPYDVVRRLGVAASALGNTLFPVFANLHGSSNKREAARIFDRSLTLFGLLLGFSMGAMFILAGDGLRLWLGSDFARHGTLALRILIVGLSINWLAEIPVVFLRACGRVDLPAKAELLVTPLDLVLLCVLVPQWGINGAALAVACGLAADSLMIFCFCYWSQGLPSSDVAHVGLKTIAVLVPMIGTAYGIYNFAPLALPSRAIVVAAMLVITILGVWSLGLSDDDRTIIRRIVLGNFRGFLGHSLA
jgi:O-antigen/teichoic acid export membrane protein